VSPGVGASVVRGVDQANRETAISKCDQCDPLGFIDYDDGTVIGGRRRCTHPDLAKELTA
jgi:hypothetical protein